MRLRYLAVLLFVACNGFGALWGADTPSLDPHLEPLRPWLGKTWRGEFKNSTPEKPVVDVATWERALNGKAVRVTHSINDGSYGGETLMIWDETKKTLKYHYFTTAGFTTEGTITVEGAVLVTLEKVSGAAGGVTEVRGRSEMKPDGTFLVKTEYLKEGAWVPARETLYKEAPGAVVKFR
jgi:hypothetical protein